MLAGMAAKLKCHDSEFNIAIFSKGSSVPGYMKICFGCAKVTDRITIRL